MNRKRSIVHYISKIVLLFKLTQQFKDINETEYGTEKSYYRV